MFELLKEKGREEFTKAAFYFLVIFSTLSLSLKTKFFLYEQFFLIWTIFFPPNVVKLDGEFNLSHWSILVFIRRNYLIKGVFGTLCLVVDGFHYLFISVVSFSL